MILIAVSTPLNARIKRGMLIISEYKNIFKNLFFFTPIKALSVTKSVGVTFTYENLIERIRNKKETIKDVVPIEECVLKKGKLPTIAITAMSWIKAKLRIFVLSPELNEI